MHPAVEYLNALFESGDLLCLSLISAKRTFKNGLPFTENKFVPFERLVADAGIKRLTKLNAENHVYISMAAFQPGATKRIKPNIANVDRCFIEADENGSEVLAMVRASVAAKEIPPPTIVVESSPAKYQFIWATEGFTIATQVSMNRTLQQKFQTDAASTDCARVLRLPGFRNLKEKYGPVKPVASIVEHNKHFLRYGPEDFNIPLTVQPDTRVHIQAADTEVQEAVEKLLAGLEAAQVSHSGVQPWNDGALKIVLSECPWADSHSNGQRGDAMCGVQPSAKYFFTCLHQHCRARNWVKDFRPYLEQRAGKKLKFKVKATKPHKISQ
jgi:hypothetical protein